MRRPALASLLLLGLLGGCAAPSRPNIILVVIDTLRADHVGAYGYERPTTPFLDELAAEGVVFERASATSSYTRESVASIFTGAMPSSAGAIGWGARPAPDTLPLAVRFADAGYRPIFASASVMLKAPAFLRGFERKRFVGGGQMASRSSPALTRAALELVEKDVDGRPIFLYVHYLDPHGPYDPPPPYRVKLGVGPGEELRLYEQIRPRTSELRAGGFGPGDPRFEHMVKRYDGELAFTDDAVRDLLSGLGDAGYLENAIVVVTSDHGEEFFEHGFVEHAWTLYEESLHVPLIFWAPGRLNPARVAVRVSILDLAPTLAALAGQPVEGFEGVSLFRSQWTGRYQPIDRHGPVLAELGIQSRSLLRSVTDGDSKFVVARKWLEPEARQNAVRKNGAGPLERGRSPIDPWGPIVREEFFDLAVDPAERQSISGRTESRSELARHLAAARLRAQRQAVDRTGETLPESEAADAMSDEERSQLEALGYL